MKNSQAGFFYEERDRRTRPAASCVVPIVINLLSPHSAIDVGCGVGTWLAVLKEHGVTNVFGLDADYVDKKYLKISPSEFLHCDLTDPPRLDGKWDLAISLEVAEHLPSKCAEDFVRYLVGLAPAVLFSAAIPFQGGHQHLNEQWPEYWVQLFAGHRYSVIDCIRHRLWNMAGIPRWYSQNILLFVEEKGLVHNPKIHTAIDNTTLEQLSIVHPDIYLSVCIRYRNLASQAYSVRGTASLFMDACKRAVKRRLGRLMGS